MTRTASPSFPDDVTALMGAGLPDSAEADAPEWIHLVPAGEISTQDRRGPYRLEDAQAVIQASFADTSRLPLDENHATDLAGPLGLPAPARGWITEMQARDDGIWGRIDWTGKGRELVKDRAYRAISPVIRHDGAKRIMSILRASLVNKPNLKGLTALNMETHVSFQSELAKLLGLAEGATPDDILKAVKKEMSDDPGEGAAATQSQLDEMGALFGLPAGRSALDVLAAAKQGRSAKPKEIEALQSELTQVSTELATLREDGAREKATSFVDGEIKKGRAGVKPLRDHYIARHMAESDVVEKEIAALPLLGRSGIVTTPPAAKDGEIALNAEQKDAARALGLDFKTYAETLKAERAANEEAL